MALHRKEFEKKLWPALTIEETLVPKLSRRAWMFLIAAVMAAISCAPVRHGAADPSTRIALERGACYGTCPIYKVEIRGDGSVTYMGERFVQVTGEQRRQVSREAVVALADRFVAAGFFDLEDAYTAEVTDLPTYTLSLSYAGRNKTVSDYGGKMAGMPEIVTTLQDEVDRVAGTDKWVKGASQ